MYYRAKQTIVTRQTIYLDYNATTPILREVADAMAPFLYEHFGNPSSTHAYGRITKRAVEQGRAQVANLLGCDPDEIIFTSGGTESNNYALKGLALAGSSTRRHIITSAIEHPATLEVCSWLENLGFRVSRLGVDATGRVNPGDLERAISSDTLLVTVMHANNEIGTIQPVAELSAIAHRFGAFMHTDAAQSVGKVPVRVEELEVDLLSIAAHKVYAPKGIGVLYVRRGIHLAPLLHGANHENGRRPGTENVLQIVGLGHACMAAGRDLKKNQRHFKTMRDRLLDGLVHTLGKDMIRVNGHPEYGLPNTLNVSFLGIEANTLLADIGDRVAASAGAACHANEVRVSSVIAALNLPQEWAMGTVRFSVGRATTAPEIDRAVNIIGEAVNRLQA